MVKAFLWIGLGAGVLLFVATCVLVWFNWSQKIWSPILSIALGGTVTVLLTILAILKEDVVEQRYATSVVFDSSAGATAFVTPATNGGLAALRFAELSTLGRPAIQKDGRTVPAIERPRTDDEVFQYSGELLQYYIFHQLVSLHRDAWVVAQVGQVVTAGIGQRPSLTRVSTYSGQDIIRIARGNRFSNSSIQRFVLEAGRLPVPQSTSIVLQHRPSSSGTGVEKHFVSLAKPSFFEITFTIEPLGMVPAVPQALSNVQGDRAQWKTVLFQISQRARFEKWTAGNWQTEEHKRWAQWLLEAIKDRLEDRLSNREHR